MGKKRREAEICDNRLSKVSQVLSFTGNSDYIDKQFKANKNKNYSM